MPATPTFAPTGRLAGPYTYFHCSSVLDTGGSSSALTHFVAGSSSGGSSAASTFVNGWLHSVTVGSHGSSGIATVWDGRGSSTQPITVVDLDTQGSLAFDCGFTNFLTIAVASSAVVADITVNFATFNG